MSGCNERLLGSSLPGSFCDGWCGRHVPTKKSWIELMINGSGQKIATFWIALGLTTIVSCKINSQPVTECKTVSNQDSYSEIWSTSRLDLDFGMNKSLDPLLILDNSDEDNDFLSKTCKRVLRTKTDRVSLCCCSAFRWVEPSFDAWNHEQRWTNPYGGMIAEEQNRESRS